MLQRGLVEATSDHRKDATQPRTIRHRAGRRPADVLVLTIPIDSRAMQWRFGLGLFRTTAPLSEIGRKSRRRMPIGIALRLSRDATFYAVGGRSVQRSACGGSVRRSGIRKNPIALSRQSRGATPARASCAVRRAQTAGLADVGKKCAIGDGVRRKTPPAADDSCVATGAGMGSHAMSALHMHENGGWTICDRDDCDVLARRRAGEVHTWLRESWLRLRRSSPGPRCLARTSGAPQE